MLINESLAAINQISAKARELADHYEDFSVQLEDATLTKLFQQQASTHRNHAEDLENVLRVAGELPRQPDPEQETLNDLIENVSNAIARDTQQAILQHRLNAEEQLLATISNMATNELSAPAKTSLAALSAACKQHLTALKRAL